MSSFNPFQQYSTDFGLGNNGIKLTLNYFDGIPDSSLIESINSNELKVCLKSLLKRNEVTKDKGLNELNHLLSSDDEVLNEIFMLLWTQFYPKMLVSEMKTIRALSHEITCKLISKWGKKISKYLRDLIPILMSGLYDADPFVSKSTSQSITSVFNSLDKIENLWERFIPQHCKLIHEVLLVETRDTVSDEKFVSKKNANTTYTRLATTCAYMMVHLLKKYPDAVLQDSNFSESLSATSLWENISMNKIDENGTKLFQVLLQLINTLHELDETNFSWADNEGLFKTIAKKLLKFLGKISVQNSVKLGATFPQIIRTLNHLSRNPTNDLWSYDKDSKSKVVEFFKIGLASTTPPTYYHEMYQFTKCKTSDQQMLLLKDECLSLWAILIEQEIKRPETTRFSTDYLTQLWMNYIDFANDRQIEYSVLEPQIIQILKVKNVMNNSVLIARFSEYMKNDHIRAEIIVSIAETENKKYVDNLFSIELAQENNSITSLMDSLLANMIESDNLDANLGLHLFHRLIKQNAQGAVVTKFIYELPTFVNVDFYEYPNQIIVDFTNSEIAKNSPKTMDLLSDYLLILMSIGLPKNVILSTVCSFNSVVLAELQEKSTDLKDFLKDYFENYAFDDPTLFKSTFLTSDMVLKLHSRAVCTNKTSEFFELSLALPHKIQKELFRNKDYFEGFRTLHSGEWLPKALPYIKEDDIAANLASEIVIDCSFQSSYMHATLLEELVTIVDANPAPVSKILDIKVSLIDRYIKTLDSNVVLSSPIGLASHLLPLNENSWFKTSSDINKITNYGLFIDSFLSKYENYLSAELVLFLTMIFEISQDYNSLANEPNDQLLDIKNTVYNGCSKDDVNYMFNNVLSLFNNDDTHIISLITNIEESSNVVGYYQCKILYKLMSNGIDNLSNKQFEDTYLPVIDKYVASVVRSKETGELVHLQTSCLLLSLQKYASLSGMSKIRNMLSAELIGTNARDMLTKNYKVIIYLNCLLESSEDYVPIQPQRVQMVLSSLNKLFDDEEWYSDAFSIVRLCVTKLFSHLVKYDQINENNLFHDVLNRLLSDIISIVQIEDTPFVFELRAYVVELYKEVSLYAIELEDEEEVCEGLMEIYFTKYTAERENQVSARFFELFGSVLKNFDVNFVHKYQERFVNVLVNIYSNLSQLRVSVMILAKMINRAKETLVVEFEFSKQKLDSPELVSDEDDETVDVAPYDKNREQFKISETYIDILKNQTPTDYLEYCDEKLGLRYLWTLYLVSLHFSAISYNLRNFYLEQLKKEGDLINALYNFIFDEIQGDETFEEYHVEQFLVYRDDVVQECKRLLVFNLYLLFDNFGVLTSNWYLNLKSRQLQIKDENFVSKIISPVLIAKELEECALKVDKLKENNEALTIKVKEKLREIRASYLIDEQKLEIAFKFPDNYPLTTIQVIGISRIGVTENKWKSWILSTQRVITSMNGSILDSLELFIKNVDLQFSGFEECAICYYVLNAIDRKLPTKQCPTCNYKFHSTCLYKWFKTSGNNTCPMCRGAFEFTNRAPQSQQVR